MKKYLFILLILLVPYFCFAEDTRCTWESNDKKFKIIVDTNDFIPNVSYDNHTIGMINSSVNNLEDNACKMQDVYYACGNYNIEGVKQDSYVCYVSYIEEDISSLSEDDEYYMIYPGTTYKGVANFKEKIERLEDGSTIVSGPPQKGSCEIIKDILKIIGSYVGPILRLLSGVVLIVITVFDFVKSMSSFDADIKKPINRFVKRFIVVIAIFLIPSLIVGIFDIFNLISGC